MGLKVTGTFGVLIKANQIGLFNELKPLLDELSEKQVWMGEKLKHEILLKAGEL
ncbi:MAG: DUF3368 domain-containing protein [Bacteroidales bacterium]